MSSIRKTSRPALCLSFHLIMLTGVRKLSRDLYINITGDPVMMCAGPQNGRIEIGEGSGWE